MWPRAEQSTHWLSGWLQSKGERKRLCSASLASSTLTTWVRRVKYSKVSLSCSPLVFYLFLVPLICWPQQAATWRASLGNTACMHLPAHGHAHIHITSIHATLLLNSLDYIDQNILWDSVILMGHIDTVYGSKLKKIKNQYTIWPNLKILANNPGGIPRKQISRWLPDSISLLSKFSHCSCS